MEKIIDRLVAGAMIVGVALSVGTGIVKYNHCYTRAKKIDILTETCLGEHPDIQRVFALEEKLKDPRICVDTTGDIATLIDNENDRISTARQEYTNLISMRQAYEELTRKESIKDQVLQYNTLRERATSLRRRGSYWYEGGLLLGPIGLFGIYVLGLYIYDDIYNRLRKKSTSDGSKNH